MNVPGSGTSRTCKEGHAHQSAQVSAGEIINQTSIDTGYRDRLNASRHCQDADTLAVGMGDWIGRLALQREVEIGFHKLTLIDEVADEIEVSGRIKSRFASELGEDQFGLPPTRVEELGTIDRRCLLIPASELEFHAVAGNERPTLVLYAVQDLQVIRGRPAGVRPMCYPKVDAAHPFRIVAILPTPDVTIRYRQHLLLALPQVAARWRAKRRRTGSSRQV